MSKRKPSKPKLPVICGADEDPEWLAGSGAGAKKGKDLVLPPDGSAGKFPLVTREEVLAKPTNTLHSSKAPGSPHPSCTVNEAHEFDGWCSNKPSDSSSNSTSSSISDSSSNSTSSSTSSSSSDSSKSSGRTGSSPRRSGKSSGHREEKGSAKGGGVDIGGDSKPGEGNGDNEDNDAEDWEGVLFKEDDQDGKSSGHRDEIGIDEGVDVDIGGDSEEGDGDNQDNDGDDWNDQDDREGAGKTLTLPPQGPKKRDTDTELDKSRADWFTNEMNAILDRRLGPNHIPSEWFQTEMDEIVVRHRQYSAGIMHKCEKCENLPHDQKPCNSYKMFFRADGTKRNIDESKEAFVQDLHTVIKFYLEDEKFRDCGERDQAISPDPSTPPSIPSDPPSPSSPPPAPSLAKLVARPVLSEHLEKYFRDTYVERVKKRSRFSNKMCLGQSKQTGLSVEQVRAINDQFEAERKQRKPMIKYNNKDWKIGTEILKKWQRDNPRSPTYEDYEWLTAQTGRSRYQIMTSLKQMRRKILGLNLKQLQGEEDPKSDPKAKGDDNPQRHFPRQDVAAPKRAKPQGGKPEAYKALIKEMLEEERRNDHQKAAALTSTVVKNKRQASTRRLSDEGAPKVARTAESENIGPQALVDTTVTSRAGEEASTSKHKNKRQASLRKLSGEGPGKVAKSAAPTSENIGPQTPVDTRPAPEPPTSVAQGSEVPPENVVMFNLDHVPIHYDYTSDMMTSTRRPPATDPLDGLDEELVEDQSAAEPNDIDLDHVHGLSYDDILDHDIDAPIDADLDPFLDQYTDLTGDEVDMYADDIENEMYMLEALPVIEADLEGVLEPNEEEAEANLQRRENSAPYQKIKKRTNRIREANSKPSPAPNRQTSNYDHDYAWFAQEIWEQMGGKKGPEIYPTVEDKMDSIIQKYENWSRGNLRHLEQGCDNSSEVNLCCYKDFDSSKDGDQVLLDFKIEMIKAINTIIQNTPGQRLNKFPQHATDVLWELSKSVDGDYKLKGEDRLTLIKKTGLEDAQIQKWWYHFHTKKQRDLGKDANRDVMTSQDPPARRPGSNPLNLIPKTTFAQRREKYFSATILPKKRGESSSTQGSGESAQEESDFDNIEQDPSDDSSNGESTFQPFRVGVYENAFREIWADMGGTKGAGKFPGVDVAVQPIIDLYKFWVKGKARHLNKRCDPSSDPRPCCWTKKFGPPKKPKQVFLEFQVEITRTINKIIKERKISRADVKIHRFPKFSRENMEKYSKSFNNAIHDLDRGELKHLKNRTGLEAEQIRKWWDQYHNRAIKKGKKGLQSSAEEGEIMKDGDEIAKKQGRNPKNRTQRGYEIDMETLANLFEEIVDIMINLNWASVFTKPVTKEEAPDYLNFVTEPMDLDTIRNKARQKLYKNQDQFRRDVWQIVLNAHKYYDNETSLQHDMPIATLADKLIKKVDSELEKRKGKLEACVDKFCVAKPNENAKAQRKPREEKRVDLAALANIFGAIVDKLYKFNVEPFHRDLFTKPVSIMETPDYAQFVKKPMDLGVICKKAQQMEYKSQDEFRMDVKQIVMNAHQYNDKKSKSKYGDSKIPPRAEALFELCNTELKRQKAEIEACMTRS